MLYACDDALQTIGSVFRVLPSTKDSGNRSVRRSPQRQAQEAVYPMREWDSLPKEWQQEYCYIVDESILGLTRG